MILFKQIDRLQRIIPGNAEIYFILNKTMTSTLLTNKNSE